MRTVNKTQLLLVALLACLPLAARAADPLPAPDLAAATAPGLPPGPGTPATKDTSADLAKNVDSIEEKATDSAKNFAKSLGGSDPLTLEDLNRARQTVSRLDAIIEVEKRVGELEKLRNERNKDANGGSGNNSNLAGAIPASALAPVRNMVGPGGAMMTNTGPMAMGLPTPNVGMPAPAPLVMHGVNGTDVSRIFGTEGKYAATLKMADGDTRTVRVGDQVNGNTVRWISSSAVGLEEKGGENHTLHVKNVEFVTSAVR